LCCRSERNEWVAQVTAEAAVAADDPSLVHDLIARQADPGIEHAFGLPREARFSRRMKPLKFALKSFSTLTHRLSAVGVWKAAPPIRLCRYLSRPKPSIDQARLKISYDC
jgi:hypothetical protein